MTGIIKQFAIGDLTIIDIDDLDPVVKLAVQRILVDGVGRIPEAMRCAEDGSDCTGSMQSVVFGVWKGDDLVGAVSVANINLVRETGDTLEVNAIVFPYLPGLSAEGERAAIGAIYLHLFRNPVSLTNGRQLAILDVMEFRKLKVLDPEDPQHARAKMITDEAEGAGFPEFEPDPEDPTRDIVRVRREGP